MGVGIVVGVRVGVGVAVGVGVRVGEGVRRGARARMPVAVGAKVGVGEGTAAAPVASTERSIACIFAATVASAGRPSDSSARTVASSPGAGSVGSPHARFRTRLNAATARLSVSARWGLRRIGNRLGALMRELDRRKDDEGTNNQSETILLGRLSPIACPLVAGS